MRTREEIEKLEDVVLAPYAMHSKDSAGRFFAEPGHPTRTCYQRDRDRIVHLRAFRNLEYKTQVFPIFEGDYYRTRLTHTIEVAQIARTIGRSLMLNEDLIEAIALAHDLGHPPFGHAGEKALDEIMSGNKIDEFLRFISQAKTSKGFNHNKRSFEIVTKEKRYPAFDGLNLTREVLVGILKHKTTYDAPSLGDQSLNEFPTLEAQIVNVADELAYLNHDIDDGLASGYIRKEDLSASALWSRTIAGLQPSTPIGNEALERNLIVKTLIDIQVKDLLETSDKEITQHHFGSVNDVKKTSDFSIKFSAVMAQERDELQQILNKKLYHHYLVERMTTKAKRVIHRLFDIYSSNPRQLPYDIYDPDKKYSKETEKEIICDFIADMTDRVALEEYQKLS
ncbi:MAG TPA: deoxyguanosinetriphosphate triphosphohydrolase [Candidatus Omnitrophota bacterium]|nr:deoxyguanosinetriphosphate triphosphohydrolase [Candidatus Omnitrophota bacterium]HQL41956.1 deoxyguanosinetriphosphate triphosphohydrolase [Candidatus Omnitrophota bacterium]